MPAATKKLDCTILLVDDDYAVRESIRLNLELAGYNVIAAGGSAEAERFLEQKHVDFVLTDILMPDRDGIELIRAIHEKYPKMRIVAMSGGGKLNAELCLRMARAFQVDGMLNKPFVLDELLLILRQKCCG